MFHTVAMLTYPRAHLKGLFLSSCLEISDACSCTVRDVKEFILGIRAEPLNFHMPAAFGWMYTAFPEFHCLRSEAFIRKWPRYQTNPLAWKHVQAANKGEA